MEGALELAEEIFHMTVRVGVPQHVRGLAEVIANPLHSTGVGLLLHGARMPAGTVAVSGRRAGGTRAGVEVLPLREKLRVLRS